MTIRSGEFGSIIRGAGHRAGVANGPETGIR